MEQSFQKSTYNFNQDENNDQNERLDDWIKIQDPSSSNEQKDEKKGKKTCKRKNLRKKWNYQQKLRYLIFIRKFQQDLENKNFRKKSTNKNWCEYMSTFVKNTTGALCRINHNANLKKYKSITGIIDYYLDTFLYDQEDLETQFKEFQKTLRENKITITKTLTAKNKHRTGRQSFSVVSCEIINQKRKQNSQIDKELIKEPLCQIIERKKPYIEMTIETLLIFQREQPVNYQHSKEQLSKISSIIDNLKNSDSKDLEVKVEEKVEEKEKEEEPPFKLEKNIQDSEIKQVKIEQIVVKEENPTQKITSRKLVIWTKQEAIKMVSFLNIEKEKFLSNDRKKKHGIYERCSKYVDTDKNPRICQRRINTLTDKYQKDINKMIEQETKRYQITQEIIEEAKKLYKEYLPFSSLKCKIKIEAISVPIMFQEKQKVELNDIICEKIKQKNSIIVFVQFQEKENKQDIEVKEKEKQQKTLKSLKNKTNNENQSDQSPPEQTFMIKVLVQNTVFQQLYKGLRLQNHKVSETSSIVYKSAAFIITKHKVQKKKYFESQQQKHSDFQKNEAKKEQKEQEVNK